MERRKHPRIRILVDLELAVGNKGVSHGVAENISREGVSLYMESGTAPGLDQMVILNFKIWTGRERLCRAVQGRVVRQEGTEVSLKFVDDDPLTQATIHDLLFYVQFDARHGGTAHDAA